MHRGILDFYSGGKVLLQEGVDRHHILPRGQFPEGFRSKADNVANIAFIAVSPALLVLGDMSVQGNIKPLRSLTEPLQVAKDNGAKRALIPIENKRSFLDVTPA